MNTKRFISRHIILQMAKIKGNKRILNAAREKHRVNYKGIPIKLSLDFSTEILQTRRER